eukprot:TRINITY_DN3488_c0_g1_i1.p1 TRINITY_DN3488_c0_g1~~TRINITY_DN3488_c0_g1_i1.p1  ORF type:complete len:537 (+),score=105.88 TRINITY_DN3488_c0_g1_i1:33-1643(+)
MDTSTRLKIELSLSLSLRNLPQMDMLSKSDPFVTVFLCTRNHQNEGFKNIGRTEIIWNNHDPDFLRRVELEYHFERYQELEFKVYDADEATAKNLSLHKFIGSVKTTVANIAGAFGGTSQFPILDQKGREVSGRKAKSALIVNAEQISGKEEIFVVMKMNLGHLPRSCFGLCGPQVKILVSRKQEDGKFSPVIQRKGRPLADIVMDTHIKHLCNSNYERTLQFSLEHYVVCPPSKQKASFETTLKDLLQNGGRFECHQTIGKVADVPISIQSKVVKQQGFLEYVRHGCEISLMVAIDFTGSNGNPSFPGSLHYIDPKGKLNDYQAAIETVGNILAEYDSDNEFPVWGFGAIVRGSFSTSRVFNANMQNDPSVRGVNGILDAYRTSVKSVSFSGPTNFAPVIERAISHCSKHFTEDSQRYSILLMLTDGEISDMGATTNAIIKASSLPLSIIIVGIGNANFDNMNILDGDDSPLTSSFGSTALRDIVQFVPFREFKKSGPEELASAVLEEVPTQFMQYCILRDASPMTRFSEGKSSS